MSAAIKMIRAVRQSYYNDPESDRWPVPKMLCVVDGGKEFSQTFRTGFAAELGPQVEAAHDATLYCAEARHERLACTRIYHHPADAKLQ
jgi:hypothetical protein